MGYGTSLGTAHEDEISYTLEKVSEKKFSDLQEINANNKSGDFQSRFYATDQSTMPLEASRKLTDALKLEGGRVVAPEVKASPEAPVELPEAVRSTFADDMFGTGKNDIRPALGHFYDTVKNAFKLPGDVYSGKVPAGSLQEIERAADLGMMMIGGPAPVAKGMADGSLGSFIGVKSKTIDKTKLYKAQEMEMNGMHPEDIWADTGTFRGADNRWRQEINDKRSQLKEGGSGLQITETVTDNPTGWTSPKNHGEVTKTVRIPDWITPMPKNPSLEQLMSWMSSPMGKPKVLGHILHHPTLYDAYPWLQNVKVYPLPKESPYYGMARGGNEIHMAELLPDTFHSTLMHEVQHLIQTHEGFAQGSNPVQFLPKALHAAEENFLKVREEALANTERELGNATRVGEMQRAVNAELEGNAKIGTIAHERLVFLKSKHPEVYQRLSNIAKSEKLLAEAKDEAVKKYKSTMGEVESRNVQARMDMDATMRHLTSPRETESYIMSRNFQHDPYSTSTSTSTEITRPVSPRWPNNDNVRPLNEHQQFIKDYDELVALREKLGTPVDNKHFGKYRTWSDLDYHKYNKAGRALNKKHDLGPWEDVKPVDLRP